MNGEEIRRVRKARKMTQQEVARVAGIAQSYLSMIESGTCDSITTDTLERIAQALGMTLSISLVEPNPQPAADPSAAHAA